MEVAAIAPVSSVLPCAVAQRPTVRSAAVAATVTDTAVVAGVVTDTGTVEGVAASLAVAPPAVRVTEATVNPPLATAVT